jgi:hypothetical protein
MTPHLKRIDSEQFADLRQQWKPFFDNNGELLYEHCRPHIDHAQRIVDEAVPDPRYGIFGLVRTDGASVVYEGFTHINHKLPRTPDAEVRLVWSTLSPRYETELNGELLAEFTFAYISGAILLANQRMIADQVRVHLGNAIDRQYAQGIVAALRGSHASKVRVALAGNWLHISGVTGLDL